MGAASSLFYASNDADKQTLFRRVTPSDEQFEEQQERWSILADHLIAELRRRSGNSVRSWLQGSYKFGTQIRPVRRIEEFDIDLGIYFEWRGEAQAGEHGPQALTGYTQDSLNAYSRVSADVLEVTPPKERCCRIRFKDGFHIDVPSYHLDPNADRRTLATTAGNWENSDPKAIYLWFRDGFDDLTRAKVRRLVKYMKAWAALKFPAGPQRPSSILVTILVADAAKSLGSALAASDDDALHEVVNTILTRMETDTEVLNPVDTAENLTDRMADHMSNFVEQLRALTDVAQRATFASDEFVAADIWQEAFEHLFPMPDIRTAVSKTSANLPTRITTPEIEVTAVSRTNPERGRYTGVNQIGPIPKDCDITFQVTNGYALPANAQLLWMVRNEGREAENTNDLGHRAGTGLRATDRSAYRGTHYMDCVVKVGNQTVAVRRVPVMISGQVLPRRNPTTKPSWVRLRGRRS